MTTARALPGEHIHIAVNETTQPFWDATKDERLVAPRCGDCHRFRMPPSPFCPHCQSKAIDWVELSGKGEVFSYTVCLKPPFPGEVFPFVPVVVSLPDADGVRLISNVVGVEIADVHVGMKVKVAWNPITDGWKVPIFEVDAAAS